MEQLRQFLCNIADEALVLRLWQSGRELLHSNMLAYLVESPMYGEALLEYLWGAPCTGYHVHALREENGIDLLILMLPPAPDATCTPRQDSYWSWLAANLIAHAPRVLAIENKFKSLPEAAQLQGYSDVLHRKTDVFARKLRWYFQQFQDGEEGGNPLEGLANPYWVADLRKVILTPADLNDVEVPLRATHSVTNGSSQRASLPAERPREVQDTWEARQWQVIAHTLRQRPMGADLESQFVASYARCLGDATSLQRGISHWCEGGDAFAQLDLLRPATDPLRLTDFLEKWRYESLTRAVRARLVTAGWGPALVREKRGLQAQFGPDLGDAPGLAVVGTFFSRGSGGTDIGLFRTGDCRFAIELQLQGRMLKLMFAFGGPADQEASQVAAVGAALDSLVALDGPTALFAGQYAPHQLGRYVQGVSIAAQGPDGEPAALEIQNEPGRLLYAKVPVWARNGQGFEGPWAELSCAQIAAEISQIAIELAWHWPAVQRAVHPHLPVV